jgi:hypothetical protein
LEDFLCEFGIDGGPDAAKQLGQSYAAKSKRISIFHHRPVFQTGFISSSIHVSALLVVLKLTRRLVKRLSIRLVELPAIPSRRQKMTTKFLVIPKGHQGRRIISRLRMQKNHGGF